MLFTVIMGYGGGTYISQVEASSPSKALRIWARKLDPRLIYRFGEKSKRDLIADLQEEASQPVPISGCAGVWYAAVLTRGGIAHLNIVATDSSA